MREGKICILDDDPSVLRSLKELLASDDLEADTFEPPYQGKARTTLQTTL
jgi:FixJ family two-component response regulator